MAYYFHKVPIGAAEETVEGLNRFLRSHRVIGVKKEFVAAGEESFWAFCVEYLTGEPAGDRAGGGRTDYREVLPPEQFKVFARLRALRKQTAEREGIPVFGVFTNEQLARMVQMPVREEGDFKKIPGIGEAKAAKYAKSFLTAMQEPTPG